MKIRKGFVTNSSSSSFILSFKDENDYKEFKEYCEEYEYIDVFNLINSIRQKNLNGLIDEEIGEVIYDKVDTNELRKLCLEEMENFFTFDKVREYLNERTKNISDFSEKIKKEKEIKETQEFKEFYKSLFVKRDKKKELDDYFNQELNKLENKDDYSSILTSPQYLSLRDELFKNNRYFDGIEHIKKDTIIVEGTVWDTNGGLLEYAIRNGLLEQEFFKWTRMVENVG